MRNVNPRAKSTKSKEKTRKKTRKISDGALDDAQAVAAKTKAIAKRAREAAKKAEKRARRAAKDAAKKARIKSRADGKSEIVHFKAWRIHCGLSQEEAGDALGLDRSYVSKVESNHNRNRYNQDFLEAAARVYGTTVRDLYRLPSDPYFKLEQLVRKIPMSHIAEAEAALHRLTK